jgi:hypothetical protein
MWCLLRVLVIVDLIVVLLMVGNETRLYIKKHFLFNENELSQLNNRRTGMISKNAFVGDYKIHIHSRRTIVESRFLLTHMKKTKGMYFKNETKQEVDGLIVELKRTQFDV